MGWFGINVSSSNLNRKEFLDKELWVGCETHKLIKSRMVGSTYYAAAEYKATGEVIGFIVLTSLHKEHRGFGWEFAYKEISEKMGPHEAKCPESILKLLSDTDDKYAIEWRDKCHVYNKKEKMYKSKKKLKGICKYNFDCGYKVGDEMELYWYEIQMYGKTKGFYTDGWHRFSKNTVLELDNLQYL